MFAIVWTIGATVDETGREKFNVFLKELIAGKNTSYPIPSEVGLKIDIPYPKEGSVYDYKYLVSIFVIVVNMFKVSKLCFEYFLYLYLNIA